MKSAPLFAAVAAVASLAACSTPSSTTSADMHAHHRAAVSHPSGLNPPGVIARSLKEEHLLKASDGKGNEVIIVRTTRAAGTRTPLHEHESGGSTCVLQGEMTLYLEGAEPQRAVAGQCYYMPAGKAMAGVNTGKDAAVMHDIFVVPSGHPVWKVVEASGKRLQDQFAPAAQ